MPASWRSSSRTDRSSPARRALKRMRWAICKARTQVNTCTRMLCPVQWNIGENETACGSFIWRKENPASDWDRYPAMTSAAGQSSWLVISTCLPKISSSGAARASWFTDQVRRRSLGWSPSSCQVMARRTQGLRVIASISAWTFSFARRVLPRARVAASSSSFLPALASVVPSNPRAWLSCSSGERVKIVRRWAPQVSRRVSYAVSPPNLSLSAMSRTLAGRVVLAVLPGVEDHGHLGRAGRHAGLGGDCPVLGEELIDHRGELGDIGPVAGVGMMGQRDPAVPGDDQAQPGQPQVASLLPGLAALRDRRLAVRRGDEGREVRHVQSDRRHVHAGQPDDPRRDLPGGLFQLLC